MPVQPANKRAKEEMYIRMYEVNAKQKKYG
jgi:hypothetical protein